MIDNRPTAPKEWARRLLHALRSDRCEHRAATVRQIALSSGISHPTLYHILRGEQECYTQILRLDKLFRLAGYELTVRLVATDYKPPSQPQDVP